MATLYLKAAGGNFNGANWSTTGSGGGDSNTPTAADNCIVESGSGSLTINTGSVCRSLDFTSGTGAYTGTATHTAGVTLTIGDATAGAGNVALKLASGMTYTLGNATTSAITFASTSGTQQTIDTAGKTIGNWTINGAGSSYIAGGAITSSGVFTLTAGTYDTGNYNHQTTTMTSSGSGTKVINYGSSTWTMSTTNTPVSMAGTNQTINAGTSTIALAGAVNAGNWGGSGATWYNVTVTAGVGFVSSLFNCNNFTYTGDANKTRTFSLVNNLTCSGTFTVSSNSDVNRVLVASNTRGTSITISAATATLANTVDFMDITGSGAATWTVAGTGATYLGDAGGNSGITFTTPTTCYVVGSASMSWSDTTRWSSSSGGSGSTTRPPLPQDDAVMDANSNFTAGRQISLDMPRMCKDLTMSSVPNAPNMTASQNVDLFGSWTNDGSVTNSFSTVTLVLSGRGTHTINFGGQSFTNTSLSQNSPGGSYTMASDFTTNATGNVSWTTGTFVTANYNLTAGTFTANGTSTRVLTFGTSTFTSLSTANTTVLGFQTAGLTISAASATLVISAASANARIVGAAGAAVTWGTLTYTVAGSTGTLELRGGWTYDTINFSDSTNARTLQLTSNTITTVRVLNMNGFASNLITLKSVTGGSTAFIHFTYGAVTTNDYIAVQDITVTNPWKYYVTNGTDTSNNRNVTFSSPGANPLPRQNVTNAAATATGATITLPTTATAGNLLLWITTHVSDPGTYTPPTGFSLAKAHNRATGSSSYIRVYYKVAAGTETSLTASWVNNVSSQASFHEWYNFTGTPTLDTTDNNDSATNTTISTGSGATNSAAPALSLAVLSANGGTGVTTTAATNGYLDDWHTNLQQSTSVSKLAFEPQTSTGSQTTTFTWTTTRVPASALINFTDVGGGTTTSTSSSTSSSTSTSSTSSSTSTSLSTSTSSTSTSMSTSTSTSVSTSSTSTSMSTSTSTSTSTSSTSTSESTSTSMSTSTSSTSSSTSISTSTSTSTSSTSSSTSTSQSTSTSISTSSTSSSTSVSTSTSISTSSTSTSMSTSTTTSFSTSTSTSTSTSSTSSSTSISTSTSFSTSTSTSTSSTSSSTSTSQSTSTSSTSSSTSTTTSFSTSTSTSTSSTSSSTSSTSSSTSTSTTLPPDVRVQARISAQFIIPRLKHRTRRG